MIARNLDDYLKVRTGKDLIDLGVVPKTSSDHVALIVYKRMVALRDRVLASLNDEILGKWKPMLKPNLVDVGPEISDPESIGKYAKVGMRVKLARPNKDNASLEGVIQNIDARFDQASILWNTGQTSPFNIHQLVLMADGGKFIDGYNLVDGIVADKDLGHRVRFMKPYKFRSADGQFMDAGGKVVEIPEGTTGTLVEYQPRVQSVTIRPDDKLKGTNKAIYKISTNEAYTTLFVSSLGQIEPLDKNIEVKRQVLLDLYPKTVLDTDRAEKVSIGVLMAKDLILHGPPGGGKSNLAKDLVSLAQLSPYIFTVDGCQVQCNPFSLFDEEFAKVVPPCPECLIRYDPDFKTSGRFKKPKPENVKVLVAKYGDGHGIEYVEGTEGINRAHLAGFKIPDLDGKRNANEYDPEGFSPGILVRTNNGIVHWDELDKVRTAVLRNMLEVANSGRMKPDQLRYTYPAHSFIVGTANDSTVFPDEINDRILLLAIRYPDDSDAAYGIVRRSFHNEVLPLRKVDIGDTYVERGQVLYDLPMPSIIERAVSSLYMKLREGYNGFGKKEIFGSNRSTLDALNAARAWLLLDQVFFDNAPKIVTEQYAVRGIQYAVCSRVTERTREEGRKAKNEFREWSEKTFSEVLKDEENVWWCKLFKHISVAGAIIPGADVNFLNELGYYEKNSKYALDSWQKIKNAYQNQSNREAQKAKSQFPFMDYLFREQPNMTNLNQDQIVELMGYYMKSKNSTKCKFGPMEELLVS